MKEKPREAAEYPAGLEGGAETPAQPFETEAYETFEVSPDEHQLREDREALAAARAALEREESPIAGSYRPDLYGAFTPDRRAGGKIFLESGAKAEAEAQASRFRASAKYMTNTISGEPIAAEYDIHTRNFSTQTRIFVLPDGRKVFAVYDHRGSWLHRGLDGLMKRLNGLKMRKVSRAEWKTQFESKSTIPVIENADPDTVLMPFLPNINAHDVFAKNDQIKDFGACAWAGAAGAEEKNALAASLMEEVERLHASGVAWGELILPNVIFTADKKPIICDPEVRYDGDLTLAEAQARDLKDLCLSIGSALAAAHGQDCAATVKNLLDGYGNPEVLHALKKLAAQKRNFLQKLFFGYEKARTGVAGQEQYDAILKAITEYELGAAYGESASS